MLSIEMDAYGIPVYIIIGIQDTLLFTIHFKIATMPINSFIHWLGGFSSIMQITRIEYTNSGIKDNTGSTIPWFAH